MLNVSVNQCTVVMFSVSIETSSGNSLLIAAEDARYVSVFLTYGKYRLWVIIRINWSLVHKKVYSFCLNFIPVAARIDSSLMLKLVVLVEFLARNYLLFVMRRKFCNYDIGTFKMFKFGKLHAEDIFLEYICWVYFWETKYCLFWHVLNGHGR